MLKGYVRATLVIFNNYIIKYIFFNGFLITFIILDNSISQNVFLDSFLFCKRLGDVVFSLILLLHIFAFILINSYLYDCTCFIHSNPV